MPTVLYFMLHDQYGTEWQNQYEKMDKVYLGLVSIPTEVSSNIKPLLILIATPFLGEVRVSRAGEV
ncbi:hypothetical protein DSO57_1011080 [Entomophthora muscae]|nr:hypothetical protein DSO57_1011080 [Entomophthora muscae]